MTNPAARRAVPAVAALLAAFVIGACSGTVPPPAPAETVVEEEWKEGALSLPAFPQEADLLPMLLSKAVPGRILIDKGSISVGRDGIVRYTVAVEGSGGARSYFYEGIRCDTREFKRYAYGNTERMFVAYPNPEWEKIFNRGLGAFRYEAYRNYFCAVGGRTLTPAEIVRTIRNPQPIVE